VLFYLSCFARPVLPVLSWLSCPGFPLLVVHRYRRNTASAKVWADKNKKRVIRSAMAKARKFWPKKSAKAQAQRSTGRERKDQKRVNEIKYSWN
jgi:hypothetical protein